MSSPRHKWLIELAGVAVVGAIVVVAVWPGEREPEYQGKKLSEWVEMQYSVEGYNGMMAIGTNAFPVLLRWIDYDPPKWKISLSGWLSKYPRLGIRKKLDWWLVGKDFHRFSCAAHAFDVLGPRAVAAVPRLRKISEHMDQRFGGVVSLLADMIEGQTRGARPGPRE